MIKEEFRLSKVLQRSNLENEILANAAIGGPTNTVIHLLALVGRMEVDLDLDGL